MGELTLINEQQVLGKDFKVYGTFNEPLFLAKDVAEWIEHSNISTMIRNVDDDEKVINIVYTLGGNQEMWFLTENGLYEVLMQSRKPIAKEFKKEVKKILKELRIKGYYQIPPKPDSYLIDNPAERARRWAEEYEERKELELKNNELKEVTVQQEKEIKVLQPKAEFHDSLVTSKDVIEVGKAVAMFQSTGLISGGRTEFFRWLRENGYLCSSDSLRNKPNSIMLMKDYMTYNPFYHKCKGKVVVSYTPYFTTKGLEYFSNILKTADV